MSNKKGKAINDKDLRRHLPSVTRLLEDKSVVALIKTYSRTLVLETIRRVLRLHGKALKEGAALPELADLVGEITRFLVEMHQDSLRPVINASGIVLHTNLGRAPLAPDAARSLARLEHGCNLETEMSTGKRGSRHQMVESLLCRLTGAEAALVVNNNAAGTFLALRAFAQGKEVIVSRGQLIEIGGSYRLPDCVEESGAIMKEVGTTNKTHLRDYKKALSPETGAILRVFPSNYRIVGFTQQVPIAELAGLKKKKSFVLIDDLGCGALVDLTQYGLPYEPTVRESLEEGADIVCCSGDKLISGPQSGIILGKKRLINQLKKHPMKRMLRVCKLTDMALEKTLRLFLEPDKLREEHPVLRMLTLDPAGLKRRAKAMQKKLTTAKVALEVRIKESNSAVGGGTMPDFPLKTFALALRHPKVSATHLSRLLRENDPPIIARISGNQVLIDLRTLLKGEDKAVHQALLNLKLPSIP